MFTYSTLNNLNPKYAETLNRSTFGSSTAILPTNPFTLSEVVVVEINDKTTVAIKTSIDGFLVWPKSLLRARATADGVLTPDNDLAKLLREILSSKPTASDGEVLNELIKQCGDKQLTATVKPYIAINSEGRRYATQLIEYNFA